MAFTPCAFHGGKYAGGANTFFLRLVRGQDTVGGKLQVCANDATLALEWLAIHAVKVSEGERFLDHEDPLTCGNCGGELPDASFFLYGNAYPRGMAESQWYAKICDACVPAVTEDLHLDQVVSRRA